MRHQDIDIDCHAEVDTFELMDDLSDSELSEYLEDREGFGNKGLTVSYNVKELTDSYFHGDLDFKPLFKEIGVENIQKIIDEMRKS